MKTRHKKVNSLFAITKKAVVALFGIAQVFLLVALSASPLVANAFSGTAATYTENTSETITITNGVVSGAAGPMNGQTLTATDIISLTGSYTIVLVGSSVAGNIDVSGGTLTIKGGGSLSIDTSFDANSGAGLSSTGAMTITNATVTVTAKTDFTTVGSFDNTDSALYSGGSLTIDTGASVIATIDASSATNTGYSVGTYAAGAISINGATLTTSTKGSTRLLGGGVYGITTPASITVQNAGVLTANSESFAAVKTEGGSTGITVDGANSIINANIISSEATWNAVTATTGNIVVTNGGAINTNVNNWINGSSTPAAPDNDADPGSTASIAVAGTGATISVDAASQINETYINSANLYPSPVISTTATATTPLTVTDVNNYTWTDLSGVGTIVASAGALKSTGAYSASSQIQGTVIPANTGNETYIIGAGVHTITFYAALAGVSNLTFEDTVLPASYQPNIALASSQPTDTTFTTPTTPITNVPTGYTISGWTTTPANQTTDANSVYVYTAGDATYIAAGAKNVPMPTSDTTYYAVYVADTTNTAIFNVAQDNVGNMAVSSYNTTPFTTAGTLSGLTTGAALGVDPLVTDNAIHVGYTLAGWSTDQATQIANKDKNGMYVTTNTATDSTYIADANMATSLVLGGNTNYYAVYTAAIDNTAIFNVAQDSAGNMAVSSYNTAPFSPTAGTLSGLTTGTALTTDPAPTDNMTHAGYTLAGWSTNQAVQGANKDKNGMYVTTNTATDPTYIANANMATSSVLGGNTNYYAVYTAAGNIAITFQDTNSLPASYAAEATLALSNQTVGQNFTAPATPAKTPAGYTISGWTTTPANQTTDANGVYVYKAGDTTYLAAGATTGIVPSANTTYYAVYAGSGNIAITFQDTNSLPASYAAEATLALSNQTVGQNFTAPTPLKTPAGYTISGWTTTPANQTTDANGVYVYKAGDTTYLAAGATTGIVPSANTTYYAVYTANTALASTVNFKYIDGKFGSGTATNANAMTTGDLLTVGIANPAPINGYTFVGWSTTDDTANGMGLAPAVATWDGVATQYYAIWALSAPVAIPATGNPILLILISLIMLAGAGLVLSKRRS